MDVVAGSTTTTHCVSTTCTHTHIRTHEWSQRLAGRQTSTRRARSTHQNGSGRLRWAGGGDVKVGELAMKVYYYHTHFSDDEGFGCVVGSVDVVGTVYSVGDELSHTHGVICCIADTIRAVTRYANTQIHTLTQNVLAQRTANFMRPNSMVACTLYRIDICGNSWRSRDSLNFSSCTLLSRIVRKFVRRTQSRGSTKKNTHTAPYEKMG